MNEFKNTIITLKSALEIIKNKTHLENRQWRRKTYRCLNRKNKCCTDTDFPHHNSCISKDLSFKDIKPSVGETKRGQVLGHHTPEGILFINHFHVKFLVLTASISLSSIPHFSLASHGYCAVQLPLVPIIFTPCEWHLLEFYLIVGLWLPHLTDHQNSSS